MSIVHAAIDESIGPLKKKVEQLSFTVDQLASRVNHLESAARAVVPAPIVGTPVAAPVSAPTPPPIPIAVPASAMASSGSLPTNPASGNPNSSAPGNSSANPFLSQSGTPPPWKIVGEDATGLVTVSVAPPPPPLPGEELGSSVDPDFMKVFAASRRKKRVSTFIVIALLLSVGLVATLSVLSYH